MFQRLQRKIGSGLARILPRDSLIGMTEALSTREPNVILQALGPRLNRVASIGSMPFDLPVEGRIEFENLSGLFASTSLDHAVIAMPIRQAAYLFGLVRQMGVAKAIEVGRYKGGSTLVIASAMDGRGEFWSIDIGEKEKRLSLVGGVSYDDQLRDTCSRLGLRASILVGDSRTFEIETGEVDLVFIDGDHSYSGVKNDFERFGRRVRVGGAVVFDDAFPEELFPSHSDTVGRLVDEVLGTGAFRLVKVVNRLAHVERLS